jgi:type IV secretory pathway TrbD component
MITYLPLLLPGVHYWTGAIGKDAPLFFGICLAIWSCMRLEKRLVSMGVATMIMLAFRPHIAMISLMALGTALLVDSKIKWWVKGGLLVGIGAAGAFVASSLDTTYSLNVSSAESVSDFMSSRSLIGEDSGADMAIAQGNILFKVFTFWLRPFFLDAENMMGYVASLENVVILMIFAFVAANFRSARALVRKVLFLRYSAIFFILATGVLAAVNFNVGLGLRQKMMPMPGLLIFFAALVAIKAAGRNLSRSREVAYRPDRFAAPANHRADVK